MAQINTAIRQLVSRLEDARSDEKLDTLQELQKLARTEAKLIGELCIQRIFEFLRESGSAEEYQESLDLILRLLKTKDSSTSTANTAIVLADVKNVELLLDLLEHEDLTVGVMSSQILTELHTKDGATLETQIHDCPAGMNKLLLRLPDKSKEEVRNQAIIFIQQLTQSNEEMKKTVVFNEGFEVLFGIIRSEGGVDDAGVVIQDCLSICNNLLYDTETCQRLFFGMGSEWAVKLSEFFSPQHLESLSLGSLRRLNDSDDAANRSTEGGSVWFDEINYARCAFLALNALGGSVGITNPKHQQLLAITLHSVISSAAFWLARRGPSYMLKPGLILLKNVTAQNPIVCSHLLSLVLTIPPAVKGKSVPSTMASMPSLQFGWKPLPQDDRQCISLLSLCVERYIFPVTPWCGEVTFSSICPDYLNMALPGITAGMANNLTEFDENDSESFSQMCLFVLEEMLSGDEMSTGMVIQYVLAPPPPSPEEEDMGALESMKPIGTILLTMVLACCHKLVEAASSNSAIGQISAQLKSDMDTAERCVNVLSLLFLHGGQLARELSTAISTAHVMMGSPITGVPSQPILIYLLSSIGRAVRIPAAHSFVSALFRLLSIASSSCLRSTKQMLEDPSNLFVMDLVTPASESAGVPTMIRTMACLFIGSCFQSLHELPPAPAGQNDKEKLTQQSFLSMIDGRIGLTRFTDILRKPLSLSSPTRGMTGGNIGGSLSVDSLSRDLFFTRGYKKFYEVQVEAIRNGIFDFYTAGGVGEESSPLQQVIEMQKEKISLLEARLSEFEETANGALSTGKSPMLSVKSKAKVQEELEEKTRVLDSLEQSWANLAEEADQLRQRVLVAEETKHALEQEVVLVNAANNSLTEQNYSLKQECSTLIEANSKIQQNHLLSSNSDDDVVTSLKSSILTLREENDQLLQQLEHSNRKISLLEDELRSPVPFEASREKKISELSSKNGDLSQSLQSQLDQIEAMTNALAEFQLQWTGMVSIVNELSSSVGLDFDSALLVPMLPDFTRDSNADMNSFSQSASAMKDRIQNCIELVSTTAGNFSDIAESMGAGVGQLRGDEGTIARITSCFDILQDQLSNADADLIAHENLIAERDATIVELEQKASLGQQDEIYAEVDTLEFTVRQQQDEINLLSESLSKSNLEVKDLRTQLSDLFDKLTLAELDRETVATENTELLAEIAESKKVREQWMTLLEEKESSYQTLIVASHEKESSLQFQLLEQKRLFDEVTSSLSMLKQGSDAELMKLQNEVASLTQEKNNSSSSLELSQQTVEKLKLEIKSLQSQVAVAKPPASPNAEGKVNDLSRKIALYELEIGKLKTAVANADSDRQSRLKLENIESQRLQTTIDSLTAQLEDKLQEIARQKQDSADELTKLTQVHNDAIHQLTEKVAVLTEEKESSFQTQNLEISRLNSFLEEKLELILSMEENKTAMLQMKNELSAEVHRLNQELTDASHETAHKVGLLEKEKHNLEQKMHLMDLELQTLRHAHSQGQQQDEFNDSLKQEIDLLNRKLDALESELVSKSNEIDSQTKQILKFQSEMNQSLVHNNELKLQLEGANERVSTLSCNLQEAESRNLELLEQFESTKRDLEDVRAAAINDVEIDFSQEDALRDELTELTQKYSELNEMHASVTDKLLATEEGKVFIEHQLKAANERVELLGSDLQEALSKNLELLKQLETSKQDLEDVRVAAIKDVTLDFNQEEILRDELAALTQKYVELNELHASVTAKLLVSEEEKRVVESNLTDARKNIDEFHQKLSAIELMNEALTEQLGTTQQDLEDLRSASIKDVSQEFSRENALDKELTELTQKYIELNDLYASVVSKSHEVEEERVALENKLKFSVHEVETLRVTVQESLKLKEANAQLQRELEAQALLLDERTVELRAFKTLSDEKLDSLRREHAHKLEAANGERRNAEILEVEVDALKQKVDKLSREQDHINADRTALREQQHELSAQYYTALEEKQLFENELAVKRSELTAAQEIENELSSINETLRKELQAEKEIIRKLSSELENAKSVLSAQTHGNAQLAQQQELARVSVQSAKLFKQLQEKEQELIKFQDLCQRREGEVAGIRTTLIDVEQEVDQLRKENEELSRKVNLEQRSARELQREVDRLLNNMHIEAVVSSSYPASPTVNKSMANVSLSFAPSGEDHDEFAVSLQKRFEAESKNFERESNRLALCAVDSFLKELIVWIQSVVEDKNLSRYELLHPSSLNSNSHSQGKVRDSPASNLFGNSPQAVHNKKSTIGTTNGFHIEIPTRLLSESAPDVAKTGETLRDVIQRALQDWQTILREQTSRLLESEKEISELSKKLVVVRENSSFKPTVPGSAIQTPIRNPNSHSIVSSTVKRSGGATSASPGTKEIARLHSDIAKERRRLHELQEEHGDLLGLLAQQEVELTVYRFSLQRAGGVRAVQRAEEKAEFVATKKYGSYTSCRSEWDEEELIADGVISPV